MGKQRQESHIRKNSLFFTFSTLIQDGYVYVDKNLALIRLKAPRFILPVMSKNSVNILELNSPTSEGRSVKGEHAGDPVL